MHMDKYNNFHRWNSCLRCLSVFSEGLTLYIYPGRTLICHETYWQCSSPKNLKEIKLYNCSIICYKIGNWLEVSVLFLQQGEFTNVSSQDCGRTSVVRHVYIWPWKGKRIKWLSLLTKFIRGSKRKTICKEFQRM